MKRMNGIFGFVAAAIVCVAMAAPASAGPVDVIVVIDESGSMSTEQAWVDEMILALDAKLAIAGVTAKYGLVGFGGYAGNGGRILSVGGGQLGTAAEFGTATSGLVTSGATEDGWAGINYALDNYTLTGDALNVILITDEDRDNTNGALTKAGLLSKLGSGLLNAVISNDINVGVGTGNGIGLNSAGAGYLEGAGGTFSTVGGSTAGDAYNFGSTTNASGDNSPYIDLAFDSGGAIWDLRKLRAGGNSADSFTAAFVDIKVQEIVKQGTVPEPGTYALFGLAAAGYAVVRRRRRNAA